MLKEEYGKSVEHSYKYKIIDRKTCLGFFVVVVLFFKKVRPLDKQTKVVTRLKSPK